MPAPNRTNLPSAATNYTRNDDNLHELKLRRLFRRPEVASRASLLTQQANLFGHCAALLARSLPCVLEPTKSARCEPKLSYWPPKLSTASSSLFRAQTSLRAIANKLLPVRSLKLTTLRPAPASTTVRLVEQKKKKKKQRQRRAARDRRGQVEIH